MNRILPLLLLFALMASCKKDKKQICYECRNYLNVYDTSFCVVTEQDMFDILEKKFGIHINAQEMRSYCREHWDEPAASGGFYLWYRTEKYVDTALLHASVMNQGYFYDSVMYYDGAKIVTHASGDTTWLEHYSEDGDFR